MDRPLSCRIIRTKKRRKTLSMTIEHDGSIVVRAPFYLPAATIEKFVDEKKTWIKRKLRQITSEERERGPKRFDPGETFLYLGQRYPLQVAASPNRLRPLDFMGDRFQLNGPCHEKARDLFVTWYREQALRIFHDRLRVYSHIMHLFPQRERISSANHQWGRCSSKNVLSFSWRLSMAPLSVIDYIVVHELAHVKEKNHSPRFWKIVETTLPDYRDQRDWLKKHGHLLNL
jgi:hypothetical protein